MSFSTNLYFREIHRFYSQSKFSSASTTRKKFTKLPLPLQAELIERVQKAKFGIFERLKQIFTLNPLLPLFKSAIQTLAKESYDSLSPEDQSIVNIYVSKLGGIASHTQFLIQGLVYLKELKPEREEATAILDRWVNDASGAEYHNRAEKRAAILSFLDDPNLDYLNLSRSRSLPDIFHLKSFQDRLVTLDLSGSPFQGEELPVLTKLPPSFSHLKALKSLNLNFNRLEELPEDIYKLSGLETLSLYFNQLALLPNSFCLLKKLRTLHLSYNQLIQLPQLIGELENLEILELDSNNLYEIPASIQQLQKLTKLSLNKNRFRQFPEPVVHCKQLYILDFSRNRLRQLPESIANCKNLSHLSLMDNQLTQLPASIDQCTELKYLYLCFNRLTEIPEVLYRLSALRYLTLSSNQFSHIHSAISSLGHLIQFDLRNNRNLTSLPDTILDLPRLCSVNLSGCGLSERVLNRLRERTQAAGYRGPRFDYSMEVYEDWNPMRTLPFETILTDLYKAIEKEQPSLETLLNHPEKESLRVWLARLSDVSDYKKGGEWRTSFIQTILHALEKAEKDPSFRDVLFAVVNGAADTCGDRVALSVINLEIQLKIAEADKSDFPALAELLIRGVWVMKQLELIAAEKVKTLYFVDELEVYLGYPVKLREKLKIPFGAISDMLYFACSSLSKSDLDTAGQIIEEQLAQKETRINFLAGHETWISALQAKYPTQYQQFLDERAKNENHLEAQANFEKRLVELTKQVLSPIDEEK